MSFNEKIKTIEEARKLHPEFNTEFEAYLGLGHSFNGAYNHFTLEDIKKYEPVELKVVEPTSPTKTAAVKPVQSKPATK
jgi:hypothetical protein